ncbi:MAG: septum formation initiator family protein [Solirubrobacteraceae bacterium]
MPPAHQSRAARQTRSVRQSRAAHHTGPRRLAPRLRLKSRPQSRRFRWERVARVSLLLVLGVVVVLYVEHARAYLASRTQADRQQQVVSRLERQHQHLLQLERSLSDPSSIVAAARRLGMVRPGEIPYSVVGSPGR